MTKTQGIVTTWNNDEHSGYIADNEGKEFFFTFSDFRALREPHIKEKVVFIPVDDGQKAQAFDIQELAFVEKQQANKLKKEPSEEPTPQKNITLTPAMINAVLFGLISIFTLALAIFYFIK